MSYERASIPILASIASVSAARKAWLCDVWGVLHNGAEVFQSAVEACLIFKERGGRVILISNSPRPASGVLPLLDNLGVERSSFDALITSGDVTRALVAENADKPIFHLGPERDHNFFDGLAINFVPAAEAAIMVCTGLFHDEYETPEDYDDMLRVLAARNIPMICGNPDLVVERGNHLLPCAGALAARYAALGQTVIQAGKPYQPIYDLALSKLPGIAKHEILAIGDGADTDIKGAAALGIDAVYIASRVHLNNDQDLTPEALCELFRNRAFRPLAALPQLRW
jgi:HAD superfamily hydrolase (TIGR01459 family)